MSAEVRGVGDARYGVERSRSLIIAAVEAFGVHAEAVTVVGAHAVHVWVRAAWGEVDVEATRDGDLVVDPVFVAQEPSIIDALGAIGLEPARPERPGIYGLAEERYLPWEQRTTIDLIVPEAYAGAGTRSARMSGQEKAASSARGLEVTIHDRHWTQLPALDGSEVAVGVHVAGPASLLVAKAHKVGERMADFEKRPDRLKEKDSGDVAMLMMVSDGSTCAETIADAVDAAPVIAEAVREGAEYLVNLYAANGIGRPREDAANALAQRFDEEDVFAAIDSWLADFTPAAKSRELLQ